MPANATVYASSAVVAADPTFDADVIIATVGPVAVDSWGQNVRLECMVAFQPGADTTAVVLTLRRNSITGQTIGTAATFPAAATIADVYNASGARSEPIGNHTYHVVITQTNASAAGNVGAVMLTATVGN